MDSGLGTITHLVVKMSENLPGQWLWCAIMIHFWSKSDVIFTI